jgi:hypothetical protein
MIIRYPERELIVLAGMVLTVLLGKVRPDC